MSIQHVAAVLDCRDPRLSGCRKLVLIALANRTDQSGVCWPSQELLAGECGVTSRTLREHLLALETDGFIVRKTTQLGKGKGSKTVYQIVLSALKVAPEEIAGADFAPEVFDSCTGSPPPLRENHQEPSIDDDDSACARDDVENKVRSWAEGVLGERISGIEKLTRLLSQSSDAACTIEDVERGVKHAARWLRSQGQVANSFGYFEGAMLAAREDRLKPKPFKAPRVKPQQRSRSDELDYFLSKARAR